MGLRDAKFSMKKTACASFKILNVSEGYLLLAVKTVGKKSSVLQSLA